LAAHNSGGLVMVQVERLAAVKSLDPRRGFPENEEMSTLKRDHFSLSGNRVPSIIFQVS